MKEQVGVYEKNICPFCDSDIKGFTISKPRSTFYCFGCSVSGTFKVDESVKNDEYRKMVLEYHKDLMEKENNEL